MKLIALFALTLGGAWAWNDEHAATTRAADRAAVERAVRDYVDALYLVEPELIERSVDPELQKFGYWRNEQGEYSRLAMTRDELQELASRWNSDGHVGDDAVKQIVVYEVLEKIACAKLVADWGVDYMHLVKVDDEQGSRWLITQIVWQSPPLGE